MIYMTDSNSNLIPFAVDNQGNMGEGLVALDTKVLWENPNPSSSFAAQDVQINNLSDYEYIQINFKSYSSGTSSYVRIFNNITSSLNFIDETFVVPSQTNFTIATRGFTINNNSISFNDAYYGLPTNTSLTPDNIRNVPTQIIGIKLVNSYAQTNKYSLDEVKVGTWIDGKPIYRKTYIINNLVLSSNYNIYDPIDTLIKMEGTLSYTNGQHQLGCYYNSNYYSGIQYSSVLKALSIYGNGYSGATAKVYIEYTKTTD